MPFPVEVKGVGLSVELLLSRTYGPRAATGAMVKATLALNPGLSRMGAVLPLLTKLVLADLPPTPARTVRPGVSLFDE